MGEGAAQGEVRVGEGAAQGETDEGVHEPARAHAHAPADGSIFPHVRVSGACAGGVVCDNKGVRQGVRQG